jgi:hypothetical protein
MEKIKENFVYIAGGISLIFALAFFIYLETNKKEFSVIVKSGEGIWTTEDWIRCDSANFVNTKEVLIWNNGSKTKIVSENVIRVKSN